MYLPYSFNYHVIFYAGSVKIRQGDGGGLVVCPLALYHDNPSSNPVDVYLLLIDGAIGK